MLNWNQIGIIAAVLFVVVVLALKVAPKLKV